jgi:hypothetical protein
MEKDYATTSLELATLLVKKNCVIDLKYVKEDMMIADIDAIIVPLVTKESIGKYAKANIDERINMITDSSVKIAGMLGLSGAHYYEDDACFISDMIEDLIQDIAGNFNIDFAEDIALHERVWGKDAKDRWEPSDSDDDDKNN